MANNITLFKKYIDNLDEVYKLAAVTSILDGDASLTQAGANANEIVIPKMSMDGLADYSRNGGYVSGDVTITHETVQFNYDRGRSFNVDNMDNEETAGVAFGQLAAEFVRTKAAPEADAVRFATYASATGVGTAAADLSDGDDVLAALVVAQTAMDEAEVPADQRILFITPTNYNLVAAVESYKSKEVLASFAAIQKVPQSRFYSAVSLMDGTTASEEAGGYAKATGAKDLNFLIVHKPAVLQYSKHIVNKVISPAENQEADAWKFFYRSYGLTDVYENKVAGIYAHTKA